MCLHSTVIFKPQPLPSKSTQYNGQEGVKHALNVALIESNNLINTTVCDRRRNLSDWFKDRAKDRVC